MDGGIWVLIAQVPGHFILVSLITLVEEERAVFFCYRILILLFLFVRVFSSYGCLRNAALFYCGTPGASINISILVLLFRDLPMVVTENQCAL